MKHRFAEGVMLIDHTKYDTIIKALFGTSGSITPKNIVLVDHDRLWTPSNSPLWSTETRQLMHTHFKTKLYTFTPGYVQLYNPGFFKVKGIENMMIKETDYNLTQLELVEGWSTKPTDVFVFSHTKEGPDYENATKQDVALIIHNDMRTVKGWFHIRLVPYSHKDSLVSTSGMPDDTDVSRVFVFDVSQGALNEQKITIGHFLTEYSKAFRLVLYQPAYKKLDPAVGGFLGTLSTHHRKEEKGIQATVNSVIPFSQIGAALSSTHSTPKKEGAVDPVDPVDQPDKEPLFVLFEGPTPDPKMHEDLSTLLGKSVSISVISIPVDLSKISEIKGSVLVLYDTIKEENKDKVRLALSRLKETDTLMVPRSYFGSPSTRGGVIPRDSFYRSGDIGTYVSLKKRSKSDDETKHFVYIISSEHPDFKQARKETDAAADYVDAKYPSTKTGYMRVVTDGITPYRTMDDIKGNIDYYLSKQLPLKYDFTLAINKAVERNNAGAVLKFARILSESTKADKNARIVVFDPEDARSNVDFQRPVDIISSNSGAARTIQAAFRRRVLPKPSKSPPLSADAGAPRAPDKPVYHNLYLTNDTGKKSYPDVTVTQYKDAPATYGHFTRIILGESSFSEALSALNKIYAYYYIYYSEDTVARNGLTIEVEKSCGLGREGTYKNIRTAYVLGSDIHTQEAGIADPRSLYDLVCADRDFIYATRPIPSYSEIMIPAGNPVVNLKERAVLVVTTEKKGRNDFMASVIDSSSDYRFPFFARIIITHHPMATGSYDGAVSVLREAYAETTSPTPENRTTVFTLEKIKVARYNTQGSCENALVEKGVLDLLSGYLTTKGLQVSTVKMPTSGSYKLEQELEVHTGNMYRYMLAYLQCPSNIVILGKLKPFKELIKEPLKKVYIALVAHSKDAAPAQSDLPQGFTFAQKDKSGNIASNKKPFSYAIITREPKEAAPASFGSQFMYMFV
jgi:hypothetical protein